MTNLDAHYAKEAQRLLQDDTLAHAFDAVRLAALNALGTVDPTNTTEIMRLQAIAGCLPDVLDELRGFIIKMGSQDGGVDLNERPTLNQHWNA